MVLGVGTAEGLAVEGSKEAEGERGTTEGVMLVDLGEEEVAKGRSEIEEAIDKDLAIKEMKPVLNLLELELELELEPEVEPELEPGLEMVLG